jgi:type IV pilus assembly protein PilN
MIRVNLLPGEDKRSGGGGGKAAVALKAGDLLVPLSVLVATALIVAGTALSQRTRADGLVRSIADVESQSRVLAPQIARVNQLARERAELDLRLGIITRLQAGRTQSVRLMDELARCIPEHMWLTQVTQDGTTSLNLEGTAFSNLVVSDLMSRMERSPLFADVELGIAERQKAAERDVVRFRVSCRVTPDEPAQ